MTWKTQRRDEPGPADPSASPVCTKARSSVDARQEEGQGLALPHSSGNKGHDGSEGSQPGTNRTDFEAARHRRGRSLARRPPAIVTRTGPSAEGTEGAHVHHQLDLRS